MDLLSIATVIGFIAPKLLIASLVLLFVGGILDMRQKKIYWVRYAAFLVATAVILLIVLVWLNYQIVSDIQQRPQS